MSDQQALSIWTVYDHPLDYPETYIARRAEIGVGVVSNTADTIADEDLEKIRDQLRDRGLTRLPRSAGDDPFIIEVWL